MSLRSRTLQFLALLAAGSLLLSACSSADGSPAEPPTPTPLPTPAIPVKPTYPVQRGDVIQIFEFAARIMPVVSLDLHFKNAGQVSRILVREGDLVKKGQLLAEQAVSVDPAALKRAQIALQKAQLNLQLAQLNAPPDSKAAALQVALKQADVDLAQLDLDQLTRVLDEAKLVAPIDGTVARLAISEGDPVEALKPALTLIDRTRLEAGAQLGTDDLQRLQEAMPVTVKPAGDLALEVKGVIRRLPYPYSASPTPAADEVPDPLVRIELQGDWTGLEGFSLASPVSVRVVLQTRTAVLWLPPQAVRKFQGNTFVVVQDGEIQRRVDVKLGLASADRVELLSGPAEGQVVVAP